MCVGLFVKESVCGTVKAQCVGGIVCQREHMCVFLHMTVTNRHTYARTHAYSHTNPGAVAAGVNSGLTGGWFVPERSLPLQSAGIT